jgi:glycosyltransferase involved in cell wall biosynthesis
MRLLLVNYGPQSGVVRALSEQLRARGTWVALFNPADRFLYKRQVSVLQIPNPRPDVLRAIFEAILHHGRYWKEYFFHSCYAFDRLSRLAGDAIERVNPDVVLQAGVLFSPGRHPERPYYLYCDHTQAIAERYTAVEGLPPPLLFRSDRRSRERSVYRNAEGIFVMSAYVKASLLADYGVDAARVRVVGAGPTVEPQPQDVNRARDSAFLFVGRDFVRKGGPQLLEAFARVRSRHPEVKLWIAGGFRSEVPIPGVIFSGQLGAKGIGGLYSTASWFVLPTLQEPFGISYLEAMSFSLPCIGSRVGAVPEIIDEGKTGLLVPPGDVDALASAMMLLVENAGLARAMGEAGQKKVASQFGWSKCADRMLQVIDSDFRGQRWSC